MKAVAVARVEASDAAVAAAFRALCASLPKVGVLDRGVFACDLRGTARLLGAPVEAGRTIVRICAAASAPCAVGIATGPFIARVLAGRTPAGEVAQVTGNERAFLAPLALEVLPLDEAVREELGLLGIRSVGAFAALERGAVLDRFGRAAAAAHALAHAEDVGTVRGMLPRRRILARRRWDHSLDSRERLLFALRAAADEVAASLAAEGLAALRLRLRLERETALPLVLERLLLPPTAEAAALVRSLRWGLEEWRVLGRVVGASLEAAEVSPLRGRQLGLFAPDGARAEEALAVAQHLRSRLGPRSVLRARVVAADARLPEREAEWTEVAT